RDVSRYMQEKGWPDSLGHRQEAARAVLRSYIHEPSTDGESENLAQQLSTEAYRRVVEKLDIVPRPDHLKYKPGERPQHLPAQAGRALPPGSPGSLLNLPAGHVTTLAEKETRLRAIAKERKVSLAAAHERETCEALYFAEVGDGVLAHARDED